MTDSEDLAATTTISERALTQMREYRIPPTPKNYLVWFTYTHGTNPQLTAHLNSLLSQKRELTTAILDDLQDRFFGGASVTDVHSIGERLRTELSALTSTIGAAGSRTAAYGNTLSAVAGQLSQHKDSTQIRPLVDGLITATKVMESHSRALEDRLQASNAEVGQLKEKLEAIQKEALTDPLTGLANRKHFDAALDQAISEANASQQPLCLLMGDVDHFKRFNDTWGHLTGDQVLRLVSKCLKDSVKGRDTAARYGGEEFAVILPGTSVINGRTVAEQIRHTVENKKIVKKSTGETLGSITLSMGCAVYDRGETADQLIQRADACLYSAKRAGRNRVITEEDIDVTEVLEGAAEARAKRVAIA
jgi:diguanylate cyclase